MISMYRKVLEKQKFIF